MFLFGISYHSRDILSQPASKDIYKSGICLFCDIYSEFDNCSRLFDDGGKISIEYKKYKRPQTYFHWKFVGIWSYVGDLTIAVTRNIILRIANNLILPTKKIVIRFGMFNKPIILRPSDPAFSAVLQWIEKRYTNNLNDSTFPPSSEGSIDDNSIALAKGDGPHNLLLFIPLNKLTLCANDKNIEEEINQLKSMVASKTK